MCGYLYVSAHAGGDDYRISWAHSSDAVGGGDLYADTPYYYCDAHTIYVLVTYVGINI